jgi:two-component system cell cycle response regulator DivK
MRTIIIIDDDDANNRLIKALLKEYDVHTARSAQEGIELARQTRPALILMDIKMPGMNGGDATRIIKKDPLLAETPVIVVTATLSGHDLQSAIDAGCDGYISKPFSPNDLKAYIRQFLS